MADRPDVKTQQMPRNLIARFAGDHQRIIKYIETLTADVTQTIPDAIAANPEAINSMLAVNAFTRAVPALSAQGDSADMILPAQIFGA